MLFDITELPPISGLLHRMRDRRFRTGFDSAGGTIRTISNAALATGIIYSIGAWFFLPAISAKFSPTCYGLSGDIGFWDGFFVNGAVRWLIALVGMPFIAKEFFIRDKRVTMVLNLAYICFLFYLLFWWLETLFRIRIS